MELFTWHLKQGQWLLLYNERRRESAMLNVVSNEDNSFDIGTVVHCLDLMYCNEFLSCLSTVYFEISSPSEILQQYVFRTISRSSVL
jgi:hypothetical protein